jgi:hypothetical protein
MTRREFDFHLSMLREIETERNFLTGFVILIVVALVIIVIFALPSTGHI